MKKLIFVIVPVFICMCILIASMSFTGGVVNEAVSSSPSVNLPTIIIDAGHGGFDGGTSTADGNAEKDINLAVSLYLNDYLKLFGFNTILTRDADVSLEDDGLSTIRQKKTSDIHNRMKLMAETENAVFLSIHQNHYSIEKYDGMQVFYSPGQSEISSALAQEIQSEVVELLQPSNNRQIKECGTSVYLIYNAVKPACLVECGFLSNKAEAQKLLTKEYQQQIAFSIAVAVCDYYMIEN